MWNNTEAVNGVLSLYSLDKVMLSYIYMYVLLGHCYFPGFNCIHSMSFVCFGDAHTALYSNYWSLLHA